MAGRNRSNIPAHIYRSLLARSGNKCAYPGCTHPVFNEKNAYVAQLCHIESVAHQKQRHNPDLTPEQVNSYDNLMFMCLKHHVETNDEVVYTPSVLRKIKYDHESRYVDNPFVIDMAHVFSLKKEAEDFWQKVEGAYHNAHSFPELKVEINTRADHPQLCDEVSTTLQSIDTLLSLIDRGDQDKYWEIFNLGLPNHLSKIRILVDQMAIKYLESYIFIHPQDHTARLKLENLRRDFLDTSTSSILAD